MVRIGIKEAYRRGVQAGLVQQQSTGAHELALTIINDGKGYPRRVKAGELILDPAYPRLMVRDMAREWLAIAQEGAKEYERQFGSAGASCFTVSDILGAAIELAEYYENHARESAAIAAVSGS
jgi:hypothetical protein